jgi:hypothetical protein
MGAPWERERSPIWKLLAWFLLAMWLHSAIDSRGGGELMWCLNVMVLGWLAKMLVRGIREERVPAAWLVNGAAVVGLRLATLLVWKGPFWLVKRIARWRERKGWSPGRQAFVSPPRRRACTSSAAAAARISARARTASGCAPTPRAW